MNSPFTLRVASSFPRRPETHQIISSRWSAHPKSVLQWYNGEHMYFTRPGQCPYSLMPARCETPTRPLSTNRGRYAKWLFCKTNTRLDAPPDYEADRVPALGGESKDQAGRYEKGTFCKTNARPNAPPDHGADRVPALGGESQDQAGRYEKGTFCKTNARPDALAGCRAGSSSTLRTVLWPTLPA